MKRIITIFVALSVVFSFGITKASSGKPDLTYLKDISTDSSMIQDWRAIALASWGEQAEVSVLGTDVNSLDLSRNILARVTQKQSSETEANRLLEFYNNDQFGSLEQLNDDIFAVLALKIAKPSWSNTSALTNIASSQNTDGSFAYKKGLSGDTDMTAAAIWVLSLDSDYSANIQKASQYIMSNKLSNGSFSATSGGSSNLPSTTWALMAIRLINQDAPTTENYLLNNMQNNGSWLAGNSASPLITSYAVLALSGKTLPFIGSFSTSTSPEKITAPTSINNPATAPSTQAPSTSKTSSPAANAQKKSPTKKRTTITTPRTQVCHSEASSSATADGNGTYAVSSARVWCE